MRRALVVLVFALAVIVPADAAATPTITFSCEPAPVSCRGWYRQPVTVHWDWLPSTATVLGGCNSNDPVDFDTPSEVRFCKVSDGQAVTVEIPLAVDMTPPVVTGATASRAPDANGWYRSPLQVAFSGTDATSGLDGCTSATYGGPDNGSAAVTGTCRDKAGNVSQASAFGLRYDATPPTVKRVRSVPGDEEVRIGWDVADAATVELWRSPGIDGASQSVVNRSTDGSIVDRRVRNGRRYDYRLLAVDEAGNLAMRTFSATPGRRLLSPADGITVDGPPMLRWTEVRGARYYNVQILRNGRKLLSAWPSKAHLKLHRAWRFDGHRVRLKPGRRYTWLVWPGRGKRSRNDYGPLIGRGTFTVAAS
jgi:hypothetical protein